MKAILRMSLMLLLCTALCWVLSSTAFAESVSGTWGNLTWVLDDQGTLTISGSGEMNDFPIGSMKDAWRQHGRSIVDVVINHGVTNVGDYAFDDSNLKTVSIPDSVTEIGRGAFSGCRNLMSLFLPTSVTSIDAGAFSYTGLRELTIPDSVTSIGVSTFYGCGNLVKITIPGSVTDIGDSVFYACDQLKSAGPIGSGSNIEFGWINAIPVHAFCDCRTLERITIPDGITTIGDGAFSSCGNLTKLIIPESVTDIAGRPYFGCTKLTTAGPIGSGCNIEFGWTDSFPSYAFNGCASLTSVTIPESFTSVGNNPFDGCSQLTNAGPLGSGCNILYSWTESIPRFAFFNCYNLKCFFVSGSITSIGTNAFYGCQSLESFIVENSNNCFQAIDGILFTKDGGTLVAYPAGKTEQAYTIPDGVTALARGAFATSKLEWVKIPEGVSALLDSCFAQCSRLQTIIFPQSLKHLANESLWRIGAKELTIPASVTSVKGHFAGGGLESISVEPANSAFTACDGVMFSKDCKTLVMFPELKTSDYYIPDGTEAIRDHAFAFNFQLCSIHIPASVKTIGDSAFYNNRSLTDVYYEGSNEDWEKIVILSGNDALNNAVLHFIGEEHKNTLILPEDLRVIESQAFIGVEGKDIYVPSKVTQIADDAFAAGTILYGKAGSYAETYASTHGFTFIAIS